MIKVETCGMLDVAKINPVITSTSDVTNYSFLTHDDDTYLIANTLTGDYAYKDDAVISAGDYLNGFLVKAWEGQKLVIDGKHITYATGKQYSDLKKDDILKIKTDGTLEVATTAPESGVYFKITDIGVTLTEAAIKAKVYVA